MLVPALHGSRIFLAFSFSASSAADALSWLETHGITVPSEESSIFTSTLESGQTFVLTGSLFSNKYYIFFFLLKCSDCNRINLVKCFLVQFNCISKFKKQIL